MATCRPSFFHILFAYSDQQFKSEWILVHFIHRLINNLLTFGLGGSIARNAVAADLKKFSFSACRDGALFLSIQIGPNRVSSHTNIYLADSILQKIVCKNPKF